MKIAITGHTKGIGAACYSRLSNNHDVHGFSRSNGYDISLPSVWDAILSLDPDVIINNAYHETGQYNLLKHTFVNWKDLNKTIINVGSYAANHKYRHYEILEYSLIKRQIQDYSHWISNSVATIRSMMFTPSWVNTDMGIGGPANCLMEPAYCAEVIEFMITSPYTIKELTLCNMK